MKDPQLQVREAGNAAMGLQMLQWETSHLVLIEENTGMPAEELIKKIKKISPDQSIIVFLEKTSMNRALQLMSKGVHDCIEPSFMTQELLAVVKKGLRKNTQENLEIVPKKKVWWKNPKVLVPIVSILLTISGGWFQHRWSLKQEQERKIRESLAEKEFSLPYTHPSAITYDGESFWVCDWFTQSIYRHKPDTFEIVSVHHFSDANPIAVTWVGSVLWVLTSDGKVEKHAADEKLSLLRSVKIRSGNPTGIAHDGNVLWICDASLKKISKYLPDEKLTVLAEYPYPGESPAGLFWDGNSLWSVDGERKALLRHRIEGNRLLIDEVKQFPQYNEIAFKLTGATFDGSRFWSISEGPSKVIRHAVEK